MTPASFATLMVVASSVSAPPCSHCPLNLSSSLLLSLQYLFKLVAHLYYCSMLVGGLSASINFLRIILFILLLNSSINGLPLYLLSLAIYLNSCINSFMILPPCSNFFNSATFTISSSPPPNSLFNPAKNSLADSYSISPASKSSSIFSFHISINCQDYKKWI